MKLNAGDIVKVAADSLKGEATPAMLVRNGFPNRFVVVKTTVLSVRADPPKDDAAKKKEEEAPTKADTEIRRRVDAVVLAECCYQIKDPETGKPFCNAHPVDLFELIERDPVNATMDEERPAWELSVSSPLGRILHLGHYQRTQKSEALILKLPILGPVSLEGPLAGLIAKKLKELL